MKDPNLRPAGRGLWPADGIYAVRAAWDADQSVWHDAVASVGVRPTCGGGARLLEIHVFDRDPDLYGRRVCCAFVERLRAEETFATADALKRQMDRDSLAARAALAAADT